MIVGLEFFVFLFATALVYWALPTQTVRKVFLVLASLGVVTYWDRWAGVVVVALAAFAFLAAHLIETRKQKKTYRTVGIIGLLLALLMFKYLGFLEETVNSIVQFFRQAPLLSIDSILRPLGISYLVFKLMSYVIDVRRGVSGRGSFLDVLLYSSLFTIFVAGPIERFKPFSSQLGSEPPGSRREDLAVGFQRIVIGLFKKTVVADWIGYFIQPIWRSDDDLSLSLRALALVGFSFQLYLDFAGYSDIAIGASRFYGLKIMENFDWPFLQPNLNLFWRHWHISLSLWIRDYVFFPLSRLSRKKFWTLVVAPLVAMGLSGLWHEASWHFFIWGVWHGVGLSIYQIWNHSKRKHRWVVVLSEDKRFTVFSTLLTYSFFTIGLLWFG